MTLEQSGIDTTSVLDPSLAHTQGHPQRQTTGELNILVLEAVWSFLLPTAPGSVCFAEKLDPDHHYDHHSL